MKRTFHFSALTVLLLSSLFSAAQTVLEKTEDKVKRFNARQAYLRGDYTKALNLYKEVAQNRQDDAGISYSIGECYYAMENYESALEYLEKAKNKDDKCSPDLYLTMGKSYHNMGEIDKALDALTKYRATVTDKQAQSYSGTSDEYDIDCYIAQCKVAKDLMAHAADVTIMNLGEKINSSFEDKGPCISADGKTLVFTSRRPEGKDPKVDREGDFKYFENIYVSQWDDQAKEWLDAEPVKGSVNTEDGYNACTSISPDGKQIFIYKNNPNEGRGGEIFVSKVTASGKWGAPKTLGKPVNTSYYEDAACVSADGKYLFFVSERTGGYGKADIYMSTRVSKDFWSEPVNLGPEVNSKYDENGLFLFPDGKTLFFSSNRPESMGSYDVFMTKMVNGKWTKPVNLGYPINGVGKDTKFVLSTDNQTAYIASYRKDGFGERDIYKVDMTRYPVMGGDVKNSPENTLSILKGTLSGEDDGKAVETEVTVKDKATGETVATASSNTDGEYFFTLKGDKTYLVVVNAKGFQGVSEEVMLPLDKKGTYTLVKNIAMKKAK